VNFLIKKDYWLTNFRCQNYMIVLGVFTDHDWGQTYPLLVRVFSHISKIRRNFRHCCLLTIAACLTLLQFL